MTTSSENTVYNKPYSKCASRSKSKHRGAHWSGMNIAAMVVGFVFFWPAGLLILFWILSGRHVQDLPAAIRQVWSQVFSNKEIPFMKETDNVVFNEYQQTQYDRISEIKNEIKEQSRRFNEFRMNARRRANEAEFREFMASSPDSNPIQG